MTLYLKVKKKNSEGICCLLPQQLEATAHIIFLIWVTYNIIQRLNNFFQLYELIRIVNTVSLDILSCRHSCMGDNMDGSASVISKKIFVNCKLIPDLLCPILYCDITINLGIQQGV